MVRVLHRTGDILAVENDGFAAAWAGGSYFDMEARLGTSIRAVEKPMDCDRGYMKVWSCAESSAEAVSPWTYPWIAITEQVVPNFDMTFTSSNRVGGTEPKRADGRETHDWLGEAGHGSRSC